MIIGRRHGGLPDKLEWRFSFLCYERSHKTDRNQIERNERVVETNSDRKKKEQAICVCLMFMHFNSIPLTNTQNVLNANNSRFRLRSSRAGAV